MTKRRMKQSEMNVLKRELGYLKETGVLSMEKIAEIDDLYEVEEKQSFTKTLLYVGSILIGAGILSFIASNWDVIGKVVKFIFILVLYATSVFAGYKLEKNYPKTSRSFYYIACLVFGAGIFLVGQMFHFGGDFQDAFLWWSLGIMPLALVLRDKWILLAASLFVLMYLTNNPYMSGHSVPYWTLLWMAALYVLNNKIGFSRESAFVTSLLPLVFLAILFNSIFHENNDYLYLLGLLYVGIGVMLVSLRGKIKEVYVFLGYTVHGIAALALSFQGAWPENWMYLPFSIVYILYLLYLIHRGSLLSIILLCALIFRFYIDLSFAFLPKSFVFIIGGLLLLGFGFYFEKQRKKGGGMHE